MRKIIIKDMLLMLMASLFLLVCSSQSYPLLEPDEARYTEIPREMVETGEYLVPRLNGVIYLEKPPLFYWLQSSALALFGVEEGSARFWNAFFASFTCMMVYLAGHVLYDRRTGWVASILLFSSLLFFAMAHFITLDMTLSAFMTASLLCLLMGLERKEDGLRRLCFYSSYAFAGFALLTKGLVGILLPGSIFVIWVLMTRRFVVMKHLYLVSGLCLFFAIILPWHILMQERIPEFFDFYIVGQHFRRYLTMAEQRYQPFWFFMPILFAGLLPWTFFAIRSLKRSICDLRFQFKEKSKETFLWIWPIVVFMFFSLSKSKLVPYILPVLPPIFLLLARDLLSYPRARWEWGCTLGFVLIAGVAVCVYPFVEPMFGYHRAILFMPQFETLAALLFLTFIFCLVLLRHHKAFPALGTLMLGTLGVFTLAIPLWSDVSDRSVKPLAMQIRAREGKFDEVMAYGKYYQDLPVYTRQIITVVEKKDELDFGMTLEDKSSYMIDQATFWERWNDPNHRVLMVISPNKYEALFGYKEHKPRIIARTTQALLVKNH
ncbi:MAG: phospholipid carrier-dependent glycosyltransferase [Gammaproteobacteria bacterium]